jgi:predicted nucleic acid-binding protein
MTVLVDTGVLYADHDRDATRHEAASDALEAVYDGEFGHPYISDYVYDEAVTLTQRRTNSVDAATRLGKRLRGVGQYPTVYALEHVTVAVFQAAVTTFERYDDQALSFTDATIIALLDRLDLDRIMSFDDDFDGIVPRVDPTTVS